MAYTINKYSGATLVVVQDGTVDLTTDLTFVGKNYAGYGEIQNENFLFLLENFSGTSQPPKPVSGQIWHDSTNGKIKFYDGTKFKTTGGAEVSTTQPTGLTAGDADDKEFEKRLKISEQLLKEREVAVKENQQGKTNGNTAQPQRSNQPSQQGISRPQAENRGVGGISQNATGGQA